MTITFFTTSDGNDVYSLDDRVIISPSSLVECPLPEGHKGELYVALNELTFRYSHNDCNLAVIWEVMNRARGEMTQGLYIAIGTIDAAGQVHPLFFYPQHYTVTGKLLEELTIVALQARNRTIKSIEASLG